MSFVSQAKKPFVWICIIVAMWCVVVLQWSSADMFQFAGNTRHYVSDRLTACRFKELRERVRTVCLTDKRVQYATKHSPSGYTNHTHRLLYFSIPKVGCSFWKRVFKVLNASNNQKSVFDISNYDVYFGRELDRVDSRVDVDRYLQDYTSFLFVRDPFARLFSGYVDKMFVPNPVAKLHGSIIFSRYRKIPASKRCDMNIPFGDFALYLTKTIRSRTLRDGHFKPITWVNNPCDINLTYIAKMEHFMDDTNYILSSVGVSLDDVSGKKGDDFEEMHEKGYMNDIIKQTFNFLK